MTTEPQTVPSNKNLSPNNLWRRRVRIAFLLGLLGLAFAPFAIRQWHLARIPEIAEPFDVDVFSNPKVAASENAFQHYHAARHQYVSKQLREKEKFPVSNFLAVRVHGWSEASPRLRKWIDDRREALVSWKRGTEC